MERRITLSLYSVAAAAVLMSLGACSPAGDRAPDRVDAPRPTGWVAPPRIESVSHSRSGLIVQGVAEPGGRVVLRGQGADAFAAVADETGRFSLRMTSPVGDALFTPEIQVGEDATAGQERLLILQQGPVAVVAGGEATRRLDDAPALGAVDSDGHALLVSGWAAPNASVTVGVGGRTQQVGADSTGHWRVMINGAEAMTIRVGGRDFAYPGAAQGGGFSVTPAGEGVLVTWPPIAAYSTDAAQARPAEARQSSWLPIKPAADQAGGRLRRR